MQWNTKTVTWDPLAGTVDPSQTVITATANQLGIFTLQAPLLCSNNERELDDRYNLTKTTLTSGEVIIDLFDIPADEDWFLFPVNKDVIYTISSLGLAERVNIRLELYDSDGHTLLASDNDAAGGFMSGIVWQAPYNGTFFVRAVGEASSASGCGATYKISLTKERRVFMPNIRPR